MKMAFKGRDVLDREINVRAGNIMWFFANHLPMPKIYLQLFKIDFLTDVLRLPLFDYF